VSLLWNRSGRSVAAVLGLVLAVGLAWSMAPPLLPVPSARVLTRSPTPGANWVGRFTATAYCKGTTTASGLPVREGVAAADPDVLPIGSIIEVDAAGHAHDGVYTVLDTGPLIQGRRIDLYLWSCYEALDFGRQRVRVTIVRYGWKPSGEPGTAGRQAHRMEDGGCRMEEAQG